MSSLNRQAANKPAVGFSMPVRNAQDEQVYTGRLNAWRRMLVNNAEQAEKAISAAIYSVQSRGWVHPHDVNRMYSQMKNGVSMPGEFGMEKRG